MEPQNAASSSQEESEPQNAATTTQEEPASGAAGPSTVVPENHMVGPTRNMEDVPVPATYPVDPFQYFVSRLVVLDPLSAKRIQELYVEIEDGPYGGPVGRRIRMLAESSAPASSSSSSGGSSDSTEPLPAIMEHLAELPFIMEAMARFQETYNVLKGSNRLISLYLTSVEHVRHKAVKVSLPFCRTAGCCLSVPIKIVDNIALNTMMMLEEKIPGITLPSDQLLQSAKRHESRKLKPCTNCALAIMRYIRGTWSQSLDQNANS